MSHTIFEESYRTTVAHNYVFPGEFNDNVQYEATFKHYRAGENPMVFASVTANMVDEEDNATILFLYTIRKTVDNQFNTQEWAEWQDDVMEEIANTCMMFPLIDLWSPVRKDDNKIVSIVKAPESLVGKHGTYTMFNGDKYTGIVTKETESAIYFKADGFNHKLCADDDCMIIGKGTNSDQLTFID